MSPSDATDLLSRLQEVEQRRRLESVAGLLSAIAVGQLLFAAFAFGHAQGPTALRLTEVLAGLTGALLISVIAASLLRRRRLERRAERVLILAEGRHKRRIAIYERHLTIDDEVVLFDAVRGVEPSEGRLVVRYQDPRAGGPVLRELEGVSSALDDVARALSAPAP